MGNRFAVGSSALRSAAASSATSEQAASDSTAAMVEPNTRHAARGRLRARCQPYTSMRRVMDRATLPSKYAGSPRCGNSCTPRVRSSSQRGADAKPASNKLNFELYSMAVSALAGYCQTTGGHTVAFAMLMSTVFITRAHVVQDRMTKAIATYGA